MEMYNTLFTVHADYIDPGTPPLAIVTLIAGIAIIVGMVGIGVLIGAYMDTKKNVGVWLAAATILLVAGILLMCVVGTQYLTHYKSIEDSQAPSIDEVIAAPEGCAIVSNRVIKTDGSMAGLNLPDDQKRATYEVEASCLDNDALDGLNALNNKIIFLDQQPLAP